MGDGEDNLPGLLLTCVRFSGGKWEKGIEGLREFEKGSLSEEEK
jgi:hypothetical protein